MLSLLDTHERASHERHHDYRPAHRVARGDHNSRPREHACRGMHQFSRNLGPQVSEPVPALRLRRACWPAGRLHRVATTCTNCKQGVSKEHQLCLCRSGAACQWRASWLSAALDELAVSCPRRRQQQASCTHHQPTPPRCENDGLQMRAGAACRVLLISQRCSSGSSSVFRQSTPEPVGGCSWCS